MRGNGSGKFLIILVFLLVAFGLIMLSSAGVVEGQKLFNSAYYFFKHQLLFGVLPGLALFFIISKINYKWWRKLALPLLILAIALMVMVFIPQFGLVIKGARRWINLGFITLQPAELLKLALIAYLAAWFGQRQATGHWTYSLVPFLMVLSFVTLLLVMQPDIKTLALITLIAVAMYFFAGAKLSHIAIMVTVLIVFIVGLSLLAPYRFDRIKAYFNPTEDKLGVSYHANQALIGVGSGGWFGLGFGQSKQKINLYLPEPVGDSIFAIIVEELGFVGGAAVIILFVFLAMVLIGIANHAHDQFGRLFALGMAVWIIAQMFVNIGAITGLLPLTGVPLPFFSYGSSSLVTLLAGLGVTANIARH